MEPCEVGRHPTSPPTCNSIGTRAMNVGHTSLRRGHIVQRPGGTQCGLPSRI